MQVARDRDEVAVTAQHERRTARGAGADRAQPVVDVADPFRTPTQQTRHERAQIDEAPALRDQGEAADAHLHARFQDDC